MRALMNDTKITSENASVTVTVNQLEGRIDRRSSTRPHTPGLERATRRYRMVNALEPIFTGGLRRPLLGVVVGRVCRGSRGQRPLGQSRTKLGSDLKLDENEQRRS